MDKKHLQKHNALLIDVEALTYYPAIETKSNRNGKAKKEPSTKHEGRRTQKVNWNICSGNNRKERKVNPSENDSSSVAHKMDPKQHAEEQNETSRLLENDEDVILKYIESSSEERINYTAEHVTEADRLNKYQYFSGQTTFSQRPQLV